MKPSVAAGARESPRIGIRAAAPVLYSFMLCDYGDICFIFLPSLESKERSNIY